MLSGSTDNKKRVKIGLAILSGLFVLSVYWVWMCQQQVSGFSQLINASGQQRMLSQKLAYIALLPEFDALILNDFEEGITLLESNALSINTMLASKDNMANERVYFKEKRALLSIYTNSLRSLVNNGIEIEAWELYLESEQVLADLDKGVALMENAATKAEAALTGAVVGSFLLLLFIVCYVFQLLVYPRLMADKIALTKYADSLSVYKRLFDDANDGVLLFDSNWTLVAANKASFEKIEQGNLSLSIASNFWLNNVFSASQGDMAAQLHKEGAWTANIDYKTLSQGQCFMAVSAMKISATADTSDYYGFMLKDVTALQNKQKETELIAQTDSLTGIFNRSAILDKLRRACLQGHNNQQNIGVLYADLDGFKKINDLYGHTTGDQILKEVSSQLAKVTSDSITLARLGGDEFLFVCEAPVSRVYLEELANKVNEIFASPFVIEGKTYRLGVSIGISVFPEHSENAEELVQYADIAMYQSKHNRVNGCEFFDNHMLSDLISASKMEVQLRQARSHNEYHHVYQPIVDLKESKVIGAELLLRWDNIELGTVSPAIFIPIAEKLEIIYDIDNWSFAKCLQSIAASNWLGYVSINLSSLHFRNVDYIHVFLSDLQNAGLKNKFIFEVTETAILEDIEQSSMVINKIKDAGFSVAIDDFGTGYTSLYYLKMLPFDYIKIDQSFISDLCENENSQSIVRAIIQLAKDLDIKVIAEGVETHNVEVKLRNMGCDYVQGYLYDKPIPLEVLNEKYHSL